MGQGGSVHCRILGILLIAEHCKLKPVEFSTEPDTRASVLCLVFTAF